MFCFFEFWAFGPKLAKTVECEVVLVCFYVQKPITFATENISEQLKMHSVSAIIYAEMFFFGGTRFLLAQRVQQHRTESDTSVAEKFTGVWGAEVSVCTD